MDSPGVELVVIEEKNGRRICKGGTGLLGSHVYGRGTVEIAPPMTASMFNFIPSVISEEKPSAIMTAHRNLQPKLNIMMPSTVKSMKTADELSFMNDL